MPSLVNGQAPGGGGAVAADDITDATAVGIALLTAANAAAGRDAIGAAQEGAAPAVESADMTGTGWSTATPSGGALASWASSPARLLLDCDPGSAGSCGVSLATLLPSRDYYDLAIRFRVVNGDNSDQTRLILACGQSATNFVQLMMFSDGRFETGTVADGSYTFWNLTSTITDLDATARTDGESWMRCHRSPGLVAWHWGRGSGGAMPTVWRPIYSSIEREVAGQWTQAQTGLLVSNGLYGGVFNVTLSGVNFDTRIDAIVAGLPGAFGGT